MPLTKPENPEQLIAQWRASPITRHYDFSDTVLWQKQEEVLWAYRKHKRVAVKSGNTVGKSFVVADIVMDWLSTQYPSKVLTTATSWTQVEDILWKEIRTFCANSKIPINADILNTQLKFNDEWFALGVSVDKPVRLQGFHSPHLLVVIDEASGIDPEIWNMIEALHPEKIVAIGNPLDNTGPFFDCFSSNLWHCITISGRECVKWQQKHGNIPALVTQEWINDVESMHGRESPWVQVHVDGEFPDEAEGTLISRKWVEDARKNELHESPEDTLRVQACDVASKHGDCETVIGYRYGHTIESLDGYLRATMTETRDRLAFLWGSKKTTGAVVDADGIGEGLPEMLAHVHVPCMEFHGGYGQKAIDDNRFSNLRTQFYWIVAKKFEKGQYDLSKLPQRIYEILKNQLCCIRVKPPDAMGRIQIETKEDLATRKIKSPDYADCFVYLEYGYWMGRYDEVLPHKWR